MSRPNEQVVEEFCAAWARRDVDEILGFFADDAVYHNMPMEPAVGHAAIRALLEMFVPPAEAIEFVIHALASCDSLVFTERTDRFVMRGGTTVAIPVAGVFEVRDGKIAAWRDYFDLQTWLNQTS